MTQKGETPKAATNGASSEPIYISERFEMNHTANPTLRQGQEYMYECVTFLFNYLTTVQGLGVREKDLAKAALADSLSIILRAMPPTTPFDKPAEDQDFQRFKTKLMRKPRKGSKLAKDLALH